MHLQQNLNLNLNSFLHNVPFPVDCLAENFRKIHRKTPAIGDAAGPS